MRERKRREGARVWGEAGRQGRAGQGRAKLGRARLGRVAGQNLTTRTTTDWNPKCETKIRNETRRKSD
jgi:hypothetical protein